jgi:hypothetical protein
MATEKFITGMYALADSATSSGNSSRIKKGLELFPEIAGNAGDTAVQRRVADARKAGIHPLYALGANTYQDKGYEVRTKKDSGEAIRDIIGRMLPSKLEKAQLRNLDADYALKMARASEIAKRVQESNSGQDKDIVDVEPYRLPAHAQKSAKASKHGLYLKTPIGGLLYKNDQVTKQQLEDQTGEIVGEISALMNTANAYGRFKRLQADAAKQYPLKTTRRGYKQKDALFNARQRNRRAHWIRLRVQDFLRGK